VSELLAHEGRRFDFFRAVTLLRKLRPSGAATGALGPIEAEPVHFGHDPSLSFHASDISAIETRAGEPARLITSFMGLLGTVSPLPTHMTEDVLGAELADEHGLRAFYDIFHHRVLSLFFRAWEKYRFEQAQTDTASDPFTLRMLAFAGVDAYAEGVDRRAALAGLAMLPLLPGRTRPAYALECALRAMLPGRAIEIEPFAFRSVRIPEEQLARLGRHSCRLGLDLSIGQSVPDRSGRFRIVVRGATFADYEGVLRGGALRARLEALLESYVGKAIEAELDLRLSPDATPPTRLGDRQGARLGLTTRLPRREPRSLRALVVLSSPDGARTRIEEEPPELDVSASASPAAPSHAYA
jgi:type VI secretion system protein ImpH